jgi:hypothetical protein
VPYRGNVELVTEPRRSGMQRLALAHFTIHLDPEDRCVFLVDAQGRGKGERVLPILPFGYYAVDNPLRIFDYDGKVVAQEGRIWKFGGGGMALDPRESNRKLKTSCGAKSAFAGAPSGN